MSIFTDPLHDQFGTGPLGYIPYGGADFGEVAAIARVVGTGTDDDFYAAWVAAADRLLSEAEDSLSKGRRESARECFLRAASFYGASYHPIYGEPIDPRLITAFRKQMAAFDRGLALGDPPIAPVRIPFETTPLPAYFIPAKRQPTEVRPLIIFTNGYDGSATDIYFASAVAASRRGYHSLIVDGPGQGAMLIEHGVRMRPDWETVVKAVFDFAESLPLVDASRIALSGWSLGGYLAARAASGEHRLRACIADPGQPGLAWGYRKFAMLKFGASPETVRDLGSMDQAIIDRMWELVEQNRWLRWVISQRGFWVHGVSDLRGYFRSAETFTMEGRTELIRCPMLVTIADYDSHCGETKPFFDQLRCPKTLLRFSAAEGAAEHCEMQNRSVLNRRVLDWLDEVMA